MQSDLVERVYCAPGNGGTGGMARNIPIGAADVVEAIPAAIRRVEDGAEHDPGC